MASIQKGFKYAVVFLTYSHWGNIPCHIGERIASVPQRTDLSLELQASMDVCVFPLCTLEEGERNPELNKLEI